MTTVSNVTDILVCNQARRGAGVEDVQEQLLAQPQQFQALVDRRPAEVDDDAAPGRLLQRRDAGDGEVEREVRVGVGVVQRDRQVGAFVPEIYHPGQLKSGGPYRGAFAPLHRALRGVVGGGGEAGERAAEDRGRQAESRRR